MRNRILASIAVFFLVFPLFGAQMRVSTPDDAPEYVHRVWTGVRVRFSGNARTLDLYVPLENGDYRTTVTFTEGPEGVPVQILASGALLIVVTAQQLDRILVGLAVAPTGGDVQAEVGSDFWYLEAIK